MPLPVPILATEVPGNNITGALWNSNVLNAITFMMNPPLFSGYQTATQTLTGTASPINMDSESMDTYNGHSTTTNTSRYVAQVAGTYMVWGGLAGGGASGQTEILAYIAKNGTEIPGSRVTDVSNSSHVYCVATCPVPVAMVVGDYVELFGAADGTTPGTHGGSLPNSSLQVEFCHS